MNGLGKPFFPIASEDSFLGESWQNKAVLSLLSRSINRRTPAQGQGHQFSGLATSWMEQLSLFQRVYHG